MLLSLLIVFPDERLGSAGKAVAPARKGCSIVYSARGGVCLMGRKVRVIVLVHAHTNTEQEHTLSSSP